ncbi:MAG: hypothetical protein D3910_03655 [Candidatus Electrothrix sp. ATG2]|nr:hypothetical protein [Candidatus Electrothrix sp. ATG2]
MNRQVAKQDIEAHYDLTVTSVDPLPGSTRAWRVQADQGVFILRLFDSKTASVHTEEVNVLRFLESSTFPAPRVLPPRNGASLIFLGGRCGYVTSFIPGDTPLSTQESAHDLGRVVGRLHALDAGAQDLQPTQSSISAERELFRQLDADPSVQAWAGYDVIRPPLKMAWESISDLNSTPKTLVHTDITYKNTVRTPDGDMILIDWDDAGLGYAVLDIGYFLVNHTVSMEGQPLPLDSAAAFLRAYLSQHHLTPSEWDALPDALIFGSIIYVLAPWDGKVSMKCWQQAEYTIAHATELRDRLMQATFA